MAIEGVELLGINHMHNAFGTDDCDVSRWECADVRNDRRRRKKKKSMEHIVLMGISILICLVLLLFQARQKGDETDGRGSQLFLSSFF